MLKFLFKISIVNYSIYNGYLAHISYHTYFYYLTAEKNSHGTWLHKAFSSNKPFKIYCLLLIIVQVDYFFEVGKRPEIY